MSEILTAEEVIKEVARCHGEEVFISSGYAAHDDLVMWMRRLVEDATKALTAERDALQQRILGMEDRLDIVTAEDAMKKIAQGGTLHNADGSQRWCWCSTLQAVGTGSAKCPPCLARDIARLTAENAALREERDRETDEFVFAADESERVRLEAERDALKAELAKWKICENCGEPLAGPGICDKAISDKEEGLEQMWEDTLTRAEKAERELAEAGAEMARLHQLLAETGWTKEPR